MSAKINISNNIETCIKTDTYPFQFEVDNDAFMASNHCIRTDEVFVMENEMEERIRYIITYAILMAAAMYAYIHRTFAFFSMCLKASTTLHDKLFKGITRATMFFYNNNSSGRILNRFSRDINVIDLSLPPALIECISVSKHEILSKSPTYEPT